MTFLREGAYEIQMVDRRNEMMTFENPGLQNAKCMTDCWLKDISETWVKELVEQRNGLGIVSL